MPFLSYSSRYQVELSILPSYLLLAYLELESDLGLHQVACSLQPADLAEGM